MADASDVTRDQLFSDLQDERHNELVECADEVMREPDILKN